ncbi:MAG: sulfatase [Candidatus Sulfomarinibacteraceae bacterium]
MIDRPSEVRFDIETVRRAVPAPTADLVADGADGWVARSEDAVTFAGNRIEIARRGEFVSLTREVDWQSDQIDGVLLSITNPGRSARGLRLYWAGSGETFSEAGISRAAEMGDGTWIALLSEHSSWVGPVIRIRLDVPTPADGETIIHSIQPIRFDYDGDTIDRAAESFWKVELNDDLRNAALVAGQKPLVWTFADTHAGVLEFSYGVLAAAPAGPRVDVAVRDPSGEWTPVFDTDSNDGPDRPDRSWREARIDLRSHGAIDAVRFELSSEIDAPRFAGLGVIANPVMMPRKPESLPANVVMISLDTLRADRLASYGYDRVTSPRLDARAATSGVLFRNTVAPSPRTLPSHTTMMTGLDCVSHGVNHHSPAPAALQTLAEILRDRGYRTVATVGGGLLNPNFGLGQGFDEYYHYAGWAGGFEELETEMAEALEKLDRGRERPFFLFFHTYEIHDPYHERDPFSDACFSTAADHGPDGLIYGAAPRTRNPEDGYALSFDLGKWIKGQPVSSAEPVPPDELPLVNCLYDSAITYADTQVERLLNRLDELGILDDTLVVVTSDHGESLGEKGLFKHANLYENNLMVPLIFVLPNSRYGGTIVDQQVGSVDIFPTILDALGFEVPSEIDGRSLMPLIRGEDGSSASSEVWSYAAYENRGLSLRIDNTVKYIFNNSANPWVDQREELFRLTDDAEETDNLVREDPETSRRLQQRVATYYRSKTTGASLVVENMDCDLVEGSIGIGSLVTRLKSVDVVDGSLTDVSSNRAGIGVRRGEVLEVFVESSEKVDIDLHGVGCGLDGPDARLQRSIDIGDRGTGLYLGLTETGWRVFEDAASLNTGGGAARLSLGVSVGEQGTDRDPMEEDLVLDQLRSLGYIQ